MFPVPSASDAGTGLWWIGVWIVCGLFCGGISATLAIRRGLPAGPWFFAGFLGLLLGVAAVLIKRPLPNPVAAAVRHPVLCPCGHENHPAARKCLGCGAALTPSASSEVDHA